MKKEYDDLFISRDDKPILVIDVDEDITIQKMISDAKSKNMDSYIELELREIKSIIKAEGLISSLSSIGKGENAHHNSLKPLIAHYKDAKNICTILVCFTIHETYPIMLLSEAIEKLYTVFEGDEDILLSILINNNLVFDEVRVNTIIKQSKRVEYILKNTSSNTEKELQLLEDKISTLINTSAVDSNNQTTELTFFSKAYVKETCKLIEKSNIGNYFKCKKLGSFAKAIYSENQKMSKYCIKKALKYADIAQMYGIASECYMTTQDKDFSTIIYKKAIKKCLKQKKTSRLHLLGQSMVYIDVEGDNYFKNWGNEMMKKAKKISDSEKNMIYTYEKQEFNREKFNRTTFIKSAKEFFISNLPIKEDEIFIVIKSEIDEENNVKAFGSYYGLEMSPLSFLIDSKKCTEEVYLAEAQDKEAMLEYIQKSKDDRDNLYIFKVLYKDFHLKSITSFYGGQYDLDCYIFDASDDDTKGLRKILKKFSATTSMYLPPIDFTLPNME